MRHFWHFVFEPGLFGSGPVRVAFLVGGLVAIVSGAVGVFTVIRRQSFAGHAISDVGTTGGSLTILAGVGTVWGFVVVGVGAAGLMELFGARRERGRDLATGIVLGAMLGLTSLFLYLDTTYRTTTGATVSVLFGTLFVISTSVVPYIIGLSVASIGLVLVLYRQLLLSSLSPDLAAAQGVRVRAVGLVYLLAMALAVSLSCVTIGAILSTALLIGPAATALRLTKRPGLAMLAAGLIGLAATWIGIVLAYDSYYWPPQDHGWPVSFFVVTLVFLFYLVADIPYWGARKQARLGLAEDDLTHDQATVRALGAR